MRHRRVLINLLNFKDKQIAGAGYFVKNLLGLWFVREDKELDITIYHASSISAADVFDIPPKPGIQLKKVQVHNFLTRIVYEQLILPFHLKNFDWYFSPTPAIPFLLRVFWPRVKSIITVHDMIPFHVSNKYGWLRSAYVKCLSKYGPSIAHRVITVSQNSKNDIVNISKVPEAKIHVIYNFLNIEFAKDNNEDAQFFLTVATLEPGKNFENTLAGFKRFIEKYKKDDFKFYWAGKVGWGYTMCELERQITALKLQDHFYLTGYLDETKKGQMLKQCTAIVYLSHYEGFGIPVLEGMYHNKPALVARSSSLPEVIGSAGILCDHKNIEAIADGLYALSVERTKYQSKISSQLKKFEKTVQIDKFLKILDT